MRKHLIILFITGTFSSFAASDSTQNTSDTIKDVSRPLLQIGISPLAMMINTAKFEINLRIISNHYLQMQGGPQFGQVDADGVGRNDIGFKPLGGYFAKLGHKFYTSDRGPGLSYFVEHGAFFYHSTLPFSRQEWIQYYEDGLEMYKYGDVAHTYTSQRIGYDIGTGMEFSRNIFYLNLSIHLGFVKKINEQPIPEGYNHTNPFNGVDYEGPRFLPTLKCGIML